MMIQRANALFLKAHIDDFSTMLARSVAAGASIGFVQPFSQTDAAAFWLGPGLVGLSYESLPWFTGAAVLSQTLPSGPIILIALLYGIGAHGIMTLNDFKALEGDKQMGVNSLPVTLGPEKAAKVACIVMIVPQLFVILALAKWGQSTHAAAVLALVLGQLWAMSVMLKDPKAKAPWYNATGVLMYVSGMMVSAFALRAVEVM